MKQKKKSIEYNFIMNVLLTMSSLVFPLISFPYISRVLSPEGLGKVTLATSVIYYFTMISQLGIPTYGIRACAKVRDNPEELTKTAQEILIINIVMSIISYIVLGMCLLFIPKLREEKLLYVIISFTIILSAIGMEWLYKALEEYAYITARSVAFKFIALISMLLLVHSKDDYVLYGAISIFAASASNICNLINARKYISLKKLPKYNFAKHMKPILVFFAMSCAVTVYTNLDTVMLGFMKTDADVGYYNAAVKVKNVLVSLITALGTVILPRASYYIEHNEREKFWITARKAMNFVMLVSIPLCIYFIIMSKETILVLAGKEYIESILPMQVILPTIVLIGMTNIMGIQIMIPIGKEKWVVYSTICGAIVDLIINAILIPRYAALGATIGTLIAELVVCIVQFILLKPRDKMLFNNVTWWKIIVALIPAIVMLVIAKLLIKGPFLSIIFTAIVFFALYAIMLFIEKENLAIECFNKMRYKR